MRYCSHAAVWAHLERSISLEQCRRVSVLHPIPGTNGLQPAISRQQGPLDRPLRNPGSRGYATENVEQEKEAPSPDGKTPKVSQGAKRTRGIADSSGSAASIRTTRRTKTVDIGQTQSPKQRHGVQQNPAKEQEGARATRKVTNSAEVGGPNAAPRPFKEVGHRRDRGQIKTTKKRSLEENPNEAHARRPASPVPKFQKFASSIHSLERMAGVQMSTVLTTAPQDTTLDELIDKLPPFEVDSESGIPLLVFCVTPSFASRAARAAHDSDLLFASVLRKADRTRPDEFEILVAVVDRLPGPGRAVSIRDSQDGQPRVKNAPFGQTGFEGVAFACSTTPHKHRASQISDQPAYKRATSSPLAASNEIATISFSPSRPGGPTPGPECQLFATVEVALPKTIFQNGLQHTLIHSAWHLDHHNPEPAMLWSKHINQYDVTLPFFGSTSDHTAHVNLPLVPLTPARRVAACMGNIIRQLEMPSLDSDGSPVTAPASQELEAAVSGFFNARAMPSQAVSVWALVVGQKMARLFPKPFERACGLTLDSLKAIWKDPPSRLVALGRRTLGTNLRNETKLCKVMSGGGGWGKKAGLLSLSPGTTFAATSVTADDHADLEDPSPLEQVAQVGDYVQFFIWPFGVPASTPPRLDQLISVKDGLEFGCIPSTTDSSPGMHDLDTGSSGSSDEPKVAVFANHFGVLSEAGFALKYRGLRPNHDDNTDLTQYYNSTRIDVPFARWTALDDRDTLQSKNVAAEEHKDASQADLNSRVATMLGFKPTASRLALHDTRIRRYEEPPEPTVTAKSAPAATSRSVKQLVINPRRLSAYQDVALADESSFTTPLRYDGRRRRWELQSERRRAGRSDTVAEHDMPGPGQDQLKLRNWSVPADGTRTTFTAIRPEFSDRRRLELSNPEAYVPFDRKNIDAGPGGKNLPKAYSEHKRQVIAEHQRIKGRMLLAHLARKQAFARYKASVESQRGTESEQQGAPLSTPPSPPRSERPGTGALVAEKQKAQTSAIKGKWTHGLTIQKVHCDPKMHIRKFVPAQPSRHPVVFVSPTQDTTTTPPSETHPAMHRGEATRFDPAIHRRTLPVADSAMRIGTPTSAVIPIRKTLLPSPELHIRKFDTAPGIDSSGQQAGDELAREPQPRTLIRLYQSSNLRVRFVHRDTPSLGIRNRNKLELVPQTISRDGSVMKSERRTRSLPRRPLIRIFGPKRVRVRWVSFNGDFRIKRFVSSPRYSAGNRASRRPAKAAEEQFSDGSGPTRTRRARILRVASTADHQARRLTPMDRTRARYLRNYARNAFRINGAPREREKPVKTPQIRITHFPVAGTKGENHARNLFRIHGARNVNSARALPPGVTEPETRRERVRRMKIDHGMRLSFHYARLVEAQTTETSRALTRRELANRAYDEMWKQLREERKTRADAVRPVDEGEEIRDPKARMAANARVALAESVKKMVGRRSRHNVYARER